MARLSRPGWLVRYTREPMLVLTGLDVTSLMYALSQIAKHAAYVWVYNLSILVWVNENDVAVGMQQGRGCVGGRLLVSGVAHW